MTIYILYHNKRNGDIPQWNYIPNPTILPRWNVSPEELDMTIVNDMPNTDIVYATIDQVPEGGKWIYLIPNLYENSIYDNPDVDIFDHLKSNHRLMTELLNGIGRVMFDIRREGFLFPNFVHGQVEGMFKLHNIPLDKVIFATCASNADKIFAANGYSIKPLTIRQFELEASLQLQVSAPNRCISNIDRRFLCFNRAYQHRVHRLQLLAKMYRRNLLDQFYYSMLDGVDSTDIVTSAATVVGIEPDSYNTIGAMQELKHHMPMLLDTDDLKTNLAWVHTKTVKSYYDKTGISVVTETLFHNNEVFFSEKTWHPMRMQHPFIVLNGCGALKQLREYGYMTFSKWWDESYDSIVDPYDRLDAIEQLIVDISNWSVAKFAQFLHESTVVCQHNLKHLATAYTRMSYNSQLHKIFYN